MRRTRPATARPAPDYPTRAAAPRPVIDADRRRFLRQLAAGAGAAFVGLPRLAHGQSLPIDFGKLDRHPAIGPAAAEAEPEREMTAVVAEEARAEEADEAEAAAPAEAEAEPEGAEPEAQASVTTIEENRALWVEPGYLVLLRWRRPADDDGPVAALEGAADAVRTFLEARVTSVDDLHNIDRLHPIEDELRTLLRGLVAPAQVDMVHLDHDCRVVCSALDPSRTYPEVIDIEGEMPSPGWE